MILVSISFGYRQALVFSLNWSSVSVLKLLKTTYVWRTLLLPTDFGALYMSGPLHGCIQNGSFFPLSSFPWPPVYKFT